MLTYNSSLRIPTTAGGRRGRLNRFYKIRCYHCDLYRTSECTFIKYGSCPHGNDCRLCDNCGFNQDKEFNKDIVEIKEILDKWVETGYLSIIMRTKIFEYIIYNEAASYEALKTWVEAKAIADKILPMGSNDYVYLIQKIYVILNKRRCNI